MLHVSYVLHDRHASAYAHTVNYCVQGKDDNRVILFPLSFLP